MKKISYLLICIFANLYISTSANNLLIDSVSLINGGADVRFLISWNNSWRVDPPTAEPNNWDAVWVFVKYATCDSTNWAHANLSLNPANHSMGSPNPSDLMIDTVSDGKGVFIHRNTAGGPANIAQISCTLRLAIPGPPASFNIKVLGIEMVYVPTGAFQVGDSASNYTFRSNFYSSSGNNGKIDAWRQSNGFTASARDTLGWTTGSLASPNANYITTSTLPAAYPMGYYAFYSMKYEISQEQYVDFLNSLTYDQQATRTAIAPNVPKDVWAVGLNSSTVGRARNCIKLKTSGLVWSPTAKTPAVYACDGNNNNVYGDVDDGNNIAMNYMNWADLAAYLDWAALRPMTELEFEKACRGTIGRVDYEYVWGLNWNIAGTVTQAYARINFGSSCSGTNGLSNGGQAGEVNSTAGGNGLCAYGVGQGNWCWCYCGPSDYISPPATAEPGPMRVGFAATGSTTRATAGATFYGAMDMGGNVWEQVVGVGTNGRTFTGVLGDGALTAAGNADATAWPSVSAADNGIGLRGGSWYETKDYLRTSDRINCYYTSNTTRQYTVGGRGIRNK